MKIRNGFVTNSSSTSFIILAKEELTPEYLAKQLGVKKNTILYDKIFELCCEIVESGSEGFYHHYDTETNSKLVKEIFGENTEKVFNRLLDKGYYLYCGKLNSDNDFESALCTDSFIINRKDFFMDASDCIW